MRNDDDPFADLLRSLEENLQRGGSLGGPPDNQPRPPRVGGGVPRRFLWGAFFLFLLILLSRSLGFITNWIWFDSVGFTSVFFTGYWAQLILFLAGAVIFWIFFLGNVIVARRLDLQGLRDSPIEQVAEGFGIRISSIFLVISIVLALMMGLAIAGNWKELLLYLNQSEFGLRDRLFKLDVSFYIFSLPVWEIARGWMITSVLLTLVACTIISGFFWRRSIMKRSSLVHLSALVALLLVLFAWQYRLYAYELVYSEYGVVMGVGYTDANARLPAYNLLLVISLVAAVVVMAVAVLRRGWQSILIVLGVWFLVNLLATGVYPSLVQNFRVKPNELNLERPYIAANIEFTRRAYDLDSITTKPYQGTQQLTASSILSQTNTVRNARLWDYRPLQQTYRQVQEKKQFYEFTDIDIDRYTIDGERRQVMLAAREMNPNQLTTSAQTWVNRKLVYTHGYGVAMSSVSEVSAEGLPNFLLRDFPIQGVISITQPQIYFGELTNDYVIARTKQPEFDYPAPDGNTDVNTKFDADSGIRMSLLNRYLFALFFGDANLVLNGDIQSDSRLLWKRNIADRIQEVAPFLRYDHDPYVVIGEDGKVYWVLDAYTWSDRFPYSEPVRNGLLTTLRSYQEINYIRNSVKVVTNAYDGSMKFYLMDPTEPIAAAYARIFPSLFTPASAMPDFLVGHLRYPEDIYTIQAEMLRTYHMTDPDGFFQKEDLWDWPQETLENQVQAIEPYYVLMQLPDRDQLDFVQILPFVPAERENMIAWMAALSDPAEYGQKVVYEFGRETTIFGPKQIEGRIDQNPEISAQLSLWNQQGSSVIRGNLIVLPIAKGLLYIEPIYLQAANGRIPELKRVILATSDRVVMAENLGLALQQLFGRRVLSDPRLAALAIQPVTNEDEVIAASEPSTSASSPSNAPDLNGSSLDELITLANQQYTQAQSALKNGDWATYGNEINALQNTLRRLAEVSGVTLPTETPAASAETPTAEATPTPGQ
ncbi:MAG: UPF0182 family protein [Caldilineaceae bacterium]